MEILPEEGLPEDVVVEEVGRPRLPQSDLHDTARLLLTATRREGKDLPLMEGPLLLVGVVNLRRRIIDAVTHLIERTRAIDVPEVGPQERNGRKRMGDHRRSYVTPTLVQTKMNVALSLPHLPNPHILSPLRLNPPSSSLAL